jgi:hypothetical protein
MGQRLNIEIRKDNKVLANAYYHWFGYTSSALVLTEEILKNIDNVNFDNVVVGAVKLLEVTGAGLTSSEIDILGEDMKNINFKKAIDRNEGLIAISPKGIESTQYREEARVEIHLDTKNIILNLYWDIEEDDYDEDDLPNFYEATIDYEKVSFEKFNSLKDEILENIENKNYYFIYNNKKYSFIE